jgi:glycerol-3-phosphate dehydrogenase
VDAEHVWSRAAELERLEDEGSFDVCVVGGGITGAGVAWAATLRGYRVALVEADDFAAGTSSRSSKLVHGGLRYLEQRRVREVRTNLDERAIVAEVASELVWPVPMVLWLEHEHGPASSPHVMGLVLRLYDRWGRTPPELRTRPVGVCDLAGSAIPHGARRGLLYHEYQVDDAALVLSVLKAAADAGAVTVNRVEATARRRDGVECVDRLTSEPLYVRARAVVWATGAWAPPGHARLVRPSVGVHLFFAASDLPLSSGFSARDAAGRRFFAVPWKGVALVGTTDRDYVGPLHRPEPARVDVEALADAVSSTLDVTAAPVARSAGIRPLLHAGGRTSDLSRRYAIRALGRETLFVTGGKLSMFRRMGEETVDRLVEAGALARAGPPATYGTTIPHWDARPVATDPEITPALVARWLRSGMAVTAEDVVARRTRHDLTGTAPASPIVASWIAAASTRVAARR